MSLRSIAVIGTLVFGMLAGPLPSDAQQAEKVYRIGILTGGSASSSRANIDPFREGLRELGYVEGKNIVIEYRHADGKRNRLPELAAGLVRSKVDVILATGTRPVAAAKQATTTIPIIAGGASDLVGRGLVSSLSRPGGNITGFTRMATEIGPKRIELLKEILSQVSRLTVIWSTRQDRAELREIESSVVASEIEVQPLRLRDPNEFRNAYAEMAAKRAEAVIILHSGVVQSHRKELLELAAKNRLASMCETPRYAHSGCLMSYGPDLSDLYRRAAAYVDKILTGANPADLPIEQPTKFNLVVNMKTAKRLGLAIPPSILYRADEVIR